MQNNMDGMNYLGSLGRNDPVRRRSAQTPIRFAPPLRGIVGVAGVALVLLGGVFMLVNMETLSLPPRSWWTLALLIPALINLKWIVFGPVLVMLSGVGMLVNTIVPERD